jgi:HNH endonuclease
MLQRTDPFDPITWGASPWEFRIYGDDGAQVFAVVDEVDYHWAIQWKWSPKFSRGGKKFYLRRVDHEGTRACRIQRTIWLHLEVMRRKGTRRPSPLHTIVDHRDGDGLNCRRRNLRWATPSLNARTARRAA